VAFVERTPVSELLPGLYRAVLDAVADLERRGRRRDAARIRAEATKVYSTAWTPAAEHRLRALQARAARIRAQRRRAGSDAVLESLARSVDLEQRPA
jgi:hypothetical protein